MKSTGSRPKGEIIFQPNAGPQTEFLSASEPQVLYGGAAGGGKVGFEHQSILTPTGWKPWTDIVVGDIISDPVTGGTQTVTHLFAWEELDVWEVEFDDGTIFDTAEQHLWKYRIAGDGANREKVASTIKMATHMESRGHPAIIQTTKPVEFDPKNVKIDPYFLGCLLGDGCITTKSISYTSHEDDWPSYFSFFGEPEVSISGQAIRFVGETRKRIVEALEFYSLLGTKSYNKFVPEDYLINSVEVRKEILRGLMDTDGYRDPGRARAEFCSVSEKLNDAVRFLAQSLGYRVSTYTKVGSYLNKVGERVSCKKAYHTYITGQDVDDIFKLSRKKSGIKGKQLGRRVVDVRKTDRKALGRCITVSSGHSLYITDDFVVTHNSYALCADPFRSFNTAGWKGLLLRRTLDELREIESITKELYPRAIPKAVYKEREKTWHFPSGATLWLSYFDKDDDLKRYYGQAYQWIAFDELTHWNSPYAWGGLFSRLRGDKGTGLYMRATSNPGGPGHQWVKKMFVDPSPPNKAFDAVDLETGEVLVYPEGHAKAGQPLLKRRFIPAKLYDNPYLTEDGRYEANLLGLPEMQRRQLLEGDWDIAEGSAFSEFNRQIHVIDPFEIPNDWVRFRACDYGYGSHTGVLWMTITPEDQVIVYRELYVTKVTAEDLADMIKDIESGERIKYGVLDSSLWHNRGDRGPSLAEKMNMKGCRWRPSDRSRGSRVAGKNEIHRRLQVDEFTEEPRMLIFNTCRNLIEQLPSIPLDKNNPEDVDTKSEDHLYDALRYGLMTRPHNQIRFHEPVQKPQPFDATFGY